jgi:NADH:ubiquinone oxidoreductase subunit 4 (subunit M)
MIILIPALVAILLITYKNKKSWLFFEIFLYFGTLFYLWYYLSSQVVFEVFSSNLTIDWLRFALVILTFFITALMLSGSYLRVKFSNKNNLLFLFLCVIMLITLYISFRVVNVIYFYIFFEASLIPIFLLVIG